MERMERIPDGGQEAKNLPLSLIEYAQLDHT
jgi:hypothetical protein